MVKARIDHPGEGEAHVGVDVSTAEVVYSLHLLHSKVALRAKCLIRLVSLDAGT